MATGTVGRVALLSIHPQYADAILDGHKQVEFRKRPLAHDVHIVLMYATSPVQKIVGRFIIAETIATTPDELWNKFRDVGGIDRESYARYYANSSMAVALVVDSPLRLNPFPLSSFTPTPTVPQSFSYLSLDVASEVVPGIAGEAQLEAGHKSRDQELFTWQ